MKVNPLERVMGGLVPLIQLKSCVTRVGIKERGGGTLLVHRTMMESINGVCKNGRLKTTAPRLCNRLKGTNPFIIVLTC